MIRRKSRWTKYQLAVRLDFLSQCGQTNPSLLYLVYLFERLSKGEGTPVDCMEQIERIKAEFVRNRKLLIAIGHETRQVIITALLGIGSLGLRVGEITARTHLSRPAVSHHLRILLDCGLVSVDKQGTKNYYSLNIGEEFQSFFALVHHIAQFKNARDAGLLETC